MIISCNKKGEPLGQGSGFVIGDGLIATNQHVIDHAAQYKVKIGNRLQASRLVIQNKEKDFAVLKVKTGEKLHRVKLGDTRRVNIGEKIFVMGSPVGLENTISEGIVSGIRKIGRKDQALLQITAPISAGSSGGPVLNARGEVIGIATASITGDSSRPVQNINLAVPIDGVTSSLEGMTGAKVPSSANVLSSFGGEGGPAIFLLGGTLTLVLRRIGRIRQVLCFLATLEHELVHVFAAILCGGKLVSLTVSPQAGGAACVTKSNFLVRLSPYCVPFLAFFVLLLSFLLSADFKPVGLMCSGAMYGNYAVGAFSSMSIQPDIQNSGGLLAYPFIFATNLVVLVVITVVIRSIYL